ncbi:unnamed protein product, partial [Symbiodinium pilosum]
ESSDNDSENSDANEYAEGLGFADRKRCSEKSNSQFEFDHHPKEEYFEEPKSHVADAGQCIELPVLQSSTNNRQGLPGLLRELEVREAVKERCAKRRRLRAQRGQPAQGPGPADEVVGGQGAADLHRASACHPE